MADTEPETVQIQAVAPPGHSRAGHRAHGWCSRCKGREVWEELHAWRQQANAAVDTAETPDRAPSPSLEGSRG